MRKYITFLQMDNWLRENPHCLDSPKLRENATEFSKNPFYEKIDIIACSDDMFIEICNRFPIDLDSDIFKSDVILESQFFDFGSDCNFTRSLNYLKPALHSHDFYEICYVWSGSCEHKHDGKSCTLVAGDFMIIAPNQEHMITVRDKSSVIFNIGIRKRAFQNILFSLLTLNHSLSSFFANTLYRNKVANYIIIHTDNSIILKRIIKHFSFECYQTNTICSDFSTSVLMQLFSYLIQRGEIDISNYTQPLDFSYTYILQYIQQNYQTVTLSFMAEFFCLSESHLSRVIKKTTGKTFSQLLREIRLSHAKQLLIRTDMTVEEIGSMVGYADTPNFVKAFKKEMSYPPMKFRELHR